MRPDRLKLDRPLSKNPGKLWLEEKSSGNSERKQMKEFLNKMKKAKLQ
jgi:hypothetical protein